MKTINVIVEGVTPLLMHSAQAMLKKESTKNPTKQYDDKIEAEKVAYRNKKKQLIVPSRCLKACFINGASWRKFGKKSAKPIVAGCTRISPIEIILLDKKDKPMTKYEIDLRTVVIQKARIVRSRPRLDYWKLKFEIIYDERIIKDAEILKLILEESGQRIGLLDNRPQKFGENGCFEITEWKVN